MRTFNELQMIDLNRIMSIVEEIASSKEKVGFNTKEACHALGIPRTTFEKLRNSGLIHYRKFGRQYIYSKEDLLDLMVKTKGREITADGKIVAELF